MTKKIKAFIKVIITTVLFTMVFSNVSFAASILELPISKDLKSAKLLDIDNVTKIAEHHIYSYLKTDIQTEGKTILTSKDFINLYDLNDNLYAYLVPLVEAGKGEIGYITVGAIEDGYDSYQIFIDNNIMSKIRLKLDEKKNGLNNKNTKTKMVFLPPMNYIIRVEDDKNTTYFDITNINGDTIDVTKHIEEKRQDISKCYEIIRNEDNKKQVERITKRSVNDNVSLNNVSIAAVVPEDVTLINEEEGKFVPVNDNGTTRYGGNQNWYTNSTQQSRGCGPTAAANITYYLAKKNSTKYGKLYPFSTIGRDDFLAHMNTLYNYIKPGVIGATSLTDWTSKVENYAVSKGVTLTRVTSNASFTLDNTATYIKDGLRADCPVATLNLQPPIGYDYAWHWMTITKYFRDIADNRWIAVSSWGKRCSINYRTHFNAMANWPGGGLMYFK